MSGKGDSGRQPNYPIESVNNALRLLLMFRDTGSIRIADASRSLGVVPSTAHRLMAMLEYHGFVTQNPETHVYGVGPRLTELGLRALWHLESREPVRASLMRLGKEVGETVHFEVLDGPDVLFVDGIEGTKAVRTAIRTGDHRPANCISGGKALLADLSSAELRELFPDSPLPKCTKRSITSLKKLEAELDRVRDRGYGISVGESDLGIAAISVAVRDPSGRAFGAFSIAMPISRYDESEVPKLLAALNAIVANSGTGV